MVFIHIKELRNKNHLVGGFYILFIRQNSVLNLTIYYNYFNKGDDMKDWDIGQYIAFGVGIIGGILSIASMTMTIWINKKNKLISKNNKIIEILNLGYYDNHSYGIEHLPFSKIKDDNAKLRLIYLFNKNINFPYINFDNKLYVPLDEAFNKENSAGTYHNVVNEPIRFKFEKGKKVGASTLLVKKLYINFDNIRFNNGKWIPKLDVKSQCDVIEFEMNWATKKINVNNIKNLYVNGGEIFMKVKQGVDWIDEVNKKNAKELIIKNAPIIKNGERNHKILFSKKLTKRLDKISRKTNKKIINYNKGIIGISSLTIRPYLFWKGKRGGIKIRCSFEKIVNNMNYGGHKFYIFDYKKYNFWFRFKLYLTMKSAKKYDIKIQEMSDTEKEMHKKFIEFHTSITENKK